MGYTYGAVAIVIGVGVAGIIWLLRNTSSEAGMCGIERLRPGYRQKGKQDNEIP